MTTTNSGSRCVSWLACGFLGVFFILQNLLPTCHAKDPYEGNKIYTLYVATQKLAEELRQLQVKARLDFYNEAEPQTDVQIRTTPENQPVLDGFISEKGLNAKVDDMPAPTDVGRKLPLGQMSWDAYYNEYETAAWLVNVASKYSEWVKLESLGKTYEKRDVWMITIQKPGGNQTMGTFVDCLIHAREWPAGSCCTYMINELTANAAEYEELLNTVTFYFIPMLNPDGFNYTHSGFRIWRKNRRPNEGAPPDDDCVGVDLNRNFPKNWNGPGASNDQCYNEYLGPSACSELECQHHRKFVESKKGKIDVYISIHTFARGLFSPFSGSSDIPSDQKDYDALNAAICAGLNSAGSYYRCGRSWTTYGISLPGTSHDFAYTAGIKYSYLLELAVGGHQPPVSQILPAARDVWVGVRIAALKKNIDGTIPPGMPGCPGGPGDTPCGETGTGTHLTAGLILILYSIIMVALEIGVFAFHRP